MRLCHALTARGRLFVLVALCVGGLCVAARADGSLASAREYFRTGLGEAQRGDWPRALAAFTAAYQLSPNTTTLFNLAGAQARCGKLLASNSNYRHLLASSDAVLTRTQRAAVAAQVAEIERRIPRLRIQITGLRADDRVVLDRARIYPDELGRDMWLDPGRHELRVFRSQARSESRTLVLAEGEARVLALSLP